MDLPPLFVKTHLFPKYESAIASAEQQMLLNQADNEDSTTSEEETESDETDEEDRQLRNRWIEGETPTLRDLDSDRAASIEIQHALGMDHVSATPPQSHRKMSSELRYVTGAESEGGSVTVEEGAQGPAVVDNVEEEEEEQSEAQSLAEFLTPEDDRVAAPSSSPETVASPVDKEQLLKDVKYVEPTLEDVLNVTGKNVGISSKQPYAVQSESQLGTTSEPDVTLLSTWAPEKTDGSRHYSVHHFCTLAVQPQLPRMLHNITRAAHYEPLPVTEEDVRSHTELDWFDEVQGITEGEREEEDYKIKKK